MDKASEAILRAQTGDVSLQERHKRYTAIWLDRRGSRQGESRPSVRDKNGEIYTVRYDAVNAMLLNEFLKEHRKVEEQQDRSGS